MLILQKFTFFAVAFGWTMPSNSDKRRKNTLDDLVSTFRQIHDAVNRACDESPAYQKFVDKIKADIDRDGVEETTRKLTQKLRARRARILRAFLAGDSAE